MKTETEINEICTAYKMVKLIISKFPTWVDEQKQEGIELQNGKVIPFWIVSGERRYDQPAGEKIQKIVNLIQDNGNGNNIKENEGANVSIIPESMTISLLEKWKKMSTFDRMLMFQKTAKEHIKYKPVSKGIEVPYVEGNTMLMEANIAFLFDWECKIDKVEIGDTAVCVYGTITVNIDGKKITRSSVGDQEINAKTTKYLAVKGAHTDMIKKGLSLFGFNGDIYRGEV